jgi:hypothetical protein
MRYLCLVHVDEAAFAGFTRDDHDRFDAENLRYEAELQAQGRYVASSPLRPPVDAVTLRVRNGRVSTTDGPYAETKEHLGGFILIEAPDLETAVEIGGRSPMARMGAIEVRAVVDL